MLLKVISKKVLISKKNVNAKEVFLTLEILPLDLQISFYYTFLIFFLVFLWSSWLSLKLFIIIIVNASKNSHLSIIH